MLLLGWQAELALACEPSADTTRIAAAGGSITEILYFLGAEERIVAVDSTSNHPEAATQLPSIGYVRALSAEGLLSLSPTLILGEHDMGPPEVLEQVARTGVSIVYVAEDPSAAGIIAKVRCVAAVLNLAEAAAPLIASRLDPLVASLDKFRAADGPKPRAALILDANNGVPIAAGADTSGHGLLQMAGAENPFAGLSGWKPVSAEAMLNADPEYIVVSQRGADGSPGDSSAHSGLRSAAFGDSNRVIAMDAMASLGFGPRTLSAALALARRMHPPADADPAIQE